MEGELKIGELAKTTGLTTKAIRYYELLGLLRQARRTESGYRLYTDDDLHRLEFVKKAKLLGLSLDEIRDILTLREQEQAPCVHVLALLDQKVAYIDALLGGLQAFREELARLRSESALQMDKLPKGSVVCGIIEKGIHGKGELALSWLEGRDKARQARKQESSRTPLTLTSRETFTIPHRSQREV